MKQRYATAAMTVFVFAVFLPRPLCAEEHVYMYPFKVTAQDTLVDGPSSDPIRITGDSMLLWVDLAPEARFAHPTLYLLISHTTTTIVTGEWWPVLNGKRALFGEPNNYTIASPFILTSSTETVLVHLYPFTLMEDDNLTDGLHGSPVRINENETLLIWVDLHPEQRFAHPTVYVLLSDERSRVLKGEWWPVLNGKPLFDTGPDPAVKYTLLSPFIKGTSGTERTRVGRALWKKYE